MKGQVEVRDPSETRNTSTRQESAGRRRAPAGAARIAVALLLLLGIGKEASYAQPKEPRFQFHAYLTQAYGKTDGLPLFGLDEEGTADYRKAALNFGLRITDRDRFVFQVAHEKNADSVFDTFREDIEIDWAYYRHRFSFGTRLNAGRFPIPFGIYNEIRDVGTILEFYRPPISIYFEGAFANESVDGVGISHSFLLGSWELGVEAYYGSWDRDELLAGLALIFEGKAEDGRGAQVWLNTPVAGLRFGLAAQRFNQEEGLSAFLRTEDFNTDTFTTFLFSVDADLERLVFRAEAAQIETAFVFARTVKIPAYYLLAGLRVTDHFEVYLQYEHSRNEFSGGPNEPEVFDPLYEDWGVSVIYRFRPQVVLRAEAHEAKTPLIDIPTDPSTPRPRIESLLVSLSLSF